MTAQRDPSAQPDGSPPPADAPAAPASAPQPDPAPPPASAPPPGTTTGPQRQTTGGFEAIHPQHRQHVEANPTGKRLAFLSLAALGVVYGDIGTSPLYSIQLAFHPSRGLAPNAVNVYGVLSLVVWALVIVVAVKYIGLIMRADNKGEGGVLALLALFLRQDRKTEGGRRRRLLLVMVGLFGSALLYGDGMITPAISVLGALEGLEVLTPRLHEYILPLAAVILVALFAVQRFGTARVGGAFGPVMAVWFTTIGVLGAMEVAREPGILLAVNPWYAIVFFRDHGLAGFLVLGAVVLVVTGAEALYADMGHFGRRPIRLAWFAVVMPALLLNYFGQGALILRDPSAAENPFFLLAPRAFLGPLVVIAAAAAIVASQALISGAFSLAQQSIQLGYSPRLTIVHTSHREAGQIYIPEINKALFVGTLILTLGFGSATALGAAYGIAVTGTMAITTMLFAAVARTKWGWPAGPLAVLTGALLLVDFALLAGNLEKVPEGGWFPLVMALVIYVLMATWKKGRAMLHHALNSGALPLKLFLDDIARRKPARVPGTAVFMTSSPEGVPVVLLHHLKHNKVLHEQVILMSILTREVPEVQEDERVAVERLEHGFARIIAQYGFMERPDIGEIFAIARTMGVRAKPNDTTFYLGRERILIADAGPRAPARPGVRRASTESGAPPATMARWRKKLFVIMSRNARSATEFFGIPPNRVVELGAQVEF